jgi:zinc protease
MRGTAWLALVPALAAIAALACGPAPQPVAPPPVASATVAPPAKGPLDEPLALDGRIRKGKLDSGLTYYVLQHPKPEHRAQIWLAVNTGSVLEDEDQRGLAHFVEHMGFNGTKRFPKNALVDFLERSGVAFGADLNASTTFDETVYTLTVPTDDVTLLDKAIGVVRDWAGDMSFDPVEVEKERGVVLEEWRLGRGAGTRLFDKEAPVLFHGSKYAERLPIGKPEIITGAPREALMRFYKDWYRPDLMAVIAVGDFSADEVEAKIKREFASLPAAQSPRVRAPIAVPPHAEPLFVIETDPEETRTNVAIVTKMAHRPMATVGDERRAIAERLYNTMLSARLDEIRRKPNAPFLFASSRAGGFVRTEDAFTQFASVKEGKVEQGYAALLTEMLRVERHGFTAPELERAKADVLRSFEQAAKERATSDGRLFARELVRNFLEDEGAPGPEVELELATKLLPTIALAELDQLGKSLGAGSRVIMVTGPVAMVKPTEAALVATTKAVAGSDIAAYADAGPSAPLMATAPTPGAVVTTRTIPELGVTEWTLANGVRVVVKPTDFKSDEVRMLGFAPGGTSLATDADFESVKFSDVLAREGGLGPLDAPSLRKALAGKVAFSSASIGEIEDDVSGGASPADLETMFQMVHLRFTSPRRDDAAISAWREQETERAKNRRLSPESVFEEDMTLFRTSGHRRRQPTTPEMIQKIDVAKAFQFYRDRFSDASGFTFVIVGTLDLDRTRVLVEAYLGSLPSTKRKETYRDIDVHRPKGVAKKDVTMGSEPKARVTLTFHGPETWTLDTDNDMRMLSAVVRMRLREILREDMSGVYGVSVGGMVGRRPKQEFTFNVAFGCAPENIDKLEKATFDEIKAIQDKGIGADYVAKVKQLRKREHETSLKENGYWVGELARAYLYGDDPKNVLKFDELLAKVSSDRVRAAAKKYLTMNQYVLGELRPSAAPAKKR